MDSLGELNKSTDKNYNASDPNKPNELELQEVPMFLEDNTSKEGSLFLKGNNKKVRQLYVTSDDLEQIREQAVKDAAEGAGRTVLKRFLEVIFIASIFTAIIGTLMYTGKLEVMTQGATVLKDTAVYMMLAGYGMLVISAAVRACSMCTNDEEIRDRLQKNSIKRTVEQQFYDNVLSQKEVQDLIDHLVDQDENPFTNIDGFKEAFGVLPKILENKNILKFLKLVAQKEEVLENEQIKEGLENLLKTLNEYKPNVNENL